MRKLTVLFAVGLALLLLGKALAVDPIEFTATVQSVNFPAVIVETTNPTPRVAQYAYDAALTNVGIDAHRDTCIFQGDDLPIWAKVHNAGYEVVDCAQVLFTLNGEEFARVHVTALYPDEIRRYSATTVAPAPCEPYTVEAHIDWPLDENPDNNDIDDTFATAEEADTCLQHHRVYPDGWTWLPGYEYPDYAAAAKYHMPLDGVVKYWNWWYTHSHSYDWGHVELFVWAADPQTGYPIDDGTGGLYDMEFHLLDPAWYIDIAYICYPVCMPVSEGEYYFFGHSNRQNTANFFCIDDFENNPDWNWYKSAGVWYQGNLYVGDFEVDVCLDVPGVMMTCENLTPMFCRGKNFYFKLIVKNRTEGNVSGPMAFSGYSGHYCDPSNVLIDLVRSKTYPRGITETYYYFDVPNAVSPGQYSASVSGTLAGEELFCCMNTDIIQCSPFKWGGHDSWELVEVDDSEVSLPTVTALHQNYPNPFNAETNISYTLAEAGNVSLKVYDITGRLVASLVDEYQQVGDHTVTWDACEVSSGVYLCKLKTGGFTSVKKMNLLK